MSATLGRQIASFLDTEKPVRGIDMRPIRREVRSVAVMERVGGGSLNPDAGDFNVTAGWGHGGRGEATMPGRGRVLQREYSYEEAAVIRASVDPLGLDASQVPAPLGESTFDIYLNDRAYWSNVPARVRSYTMGGYPVLKKWLSYRDRSVLERPLLRQELDGFSNMARRIAALCLMEPRLDANYRTVIAAAYMWPHADGKTSKTLPLW